MNQQCTRCSRWTSIVHIQQMNQRCLLQMTYQYAQLLHILQMNQQRYTKHNSVLRDKWPALASSHRRDLCFTTQPIHSWDVGRNILLDVWSMTKPLHHNCTRDVSPTWKIHYVDRSTLAGVVHRYSWRKRSRVLLMWHVNASTSLMLLLHTPPYWCLIITNISEASTNCK